MAENDPGVLDQIKAWYMMNDPNIAANLKLRERIALAQMSRRSAFPKNVGEGLMSIGNDKGSRRLYRAACCRSGCRASPFLCSRRRQHGCAVDTATGPRRNATATVTGNPVTTGSTAIRRTGRAGANAVSSRHAGLAQCQPAAAFHTAATGCSRHSAPAAPAAERSDRRHAGRRPG
jgi:hypothetical protein